MISASGDINVFANRRCITEQRKCKCQWIWEEIWILRSKNRRPKILKQNFQNTVSYGWCIMINIKDMQETSSKMPRKIQVAEIKKLRN